MHGGSDGIVHGCWQPLPGSPGTKIWPLIRKVDIVSSNSYVIASGDLILVIDPGGLFEQAEELRCAIEALHGSTAQPVLVLLTHAHIDHCRVLMDHPFFGNPDRALPVVHEDGARSLATADVRLTQAALLGLQITPVRAAVRLFADLNNERCGEVTVPCGRGQTARLSTAFQAGPTGAVRVCQTLNAGTSCTVRLYPAPGHSPDSICILIGSVLFTGDLLFAASPGVAGMSGWDRTALLRSIDDVLALLRDGTITHCCPGHGRILSCDEAVKALLCVQRDAAALDGIEELNLARVQETALYAEGLMDEVSGLFTIIAARLLFVSHVLDELEEDGEAGDVAGLIDAARIDGLLFEFQQFSATCRAGSRRDIHLALKAGQIVQKLEKEFTRDQLEMVLDPGWLARAERLLNDYTTVLRGFRPPRMLQPVEVGELVSGLLLQLKKGSASDEDLFSSADDRTAFMRALVRRIARVTAFDAVTCSVAPEATGRTAELDQAVFRDLIRVLLEDMAGSGQKEIGIRVSAGDRLLSVTIEGADTGTLPPFREIRRRFLEGECFRSGGRLFLQQDAVPPRVRIDLPSP